MKNEMGNLNLGHGVNVTFPVDGTEPVVQPTETLKKLKGRQPGTKVENIVTHDVFIPKYRELVQQGKSIPEIAKFFGLKEATVIQKRLSYNKASAAAGHPIDLPLPKSAGTKGAKKIDWSALATRIQESVSA